MPHRLTRFVLGASLGIATLAAPAIAGTECPPSKHDCYTTGTPGCSDQECCLAVCNEDPFCCNAAWDASCVNRAFSLCGAPSCDFACPAGSIPEGEPCGTSLNGGCDLPIVGDSTCCTAHVTGGCDDPVCEAAVCGFEPFCCSAGWDSFCVQLALDLCPDTCQLGAPAFTPIACGQTICGTVWADGNARDTDWYEFTIAANTTVTFTAKSTQDLIIGIVDNDGVPICGGSNFLSPSASTGVCGTASVTACLVPGTYWFVAKPSNFNGFPCGGTFNDYWVAMSCGGSCVPPTCGSPTTGSCFEPTGSPFCNDATCCDSVCAVNPFCCDVAWDVTCVGEAKIYCVFCDLPTVPGTVLEIEPCGEDTNGGCNLPQLGTSDCCFAGTGPSCSDPDCSAAVCAIDAFCCEVLWDAICATYTPFLCPKLCPLGEPGFEPIACGDTIRGTAWADNGFKDTDWYELTLTEVTPITFQGVAQFPLLIGVVDTGGSGGCVAGSATGQLNPLALANPCTEASITTCLEPGTWYLFVAPAVTFGWPCEPEPACNCPDLNRDGVVNAADLTILLSAWGTTDPCTDLDGSGGPVGAADLTVLLSAWGPFSCPTGSNAYQVTLTCGGPCNNLPNDFCSDAIAIGLGDTPFSTAGATSGGPLLSPTCEEGFGTLFVRDIWFTYTATETGFLTVSTCSQANFDTRLAAYVGLCGDLEIVACNDDDAACEPFFTSRMQFFVQQGQTYRLRVGSFADFGSGVLTLSFE